MAKDAYWEGVYRKVQSELNELRDGRDLMLSDLQEANDMIVQRERLLEYLKPLLEEGDADLNQIVQVANLGLAEACREVLRRVNQFRTARGVRDTLEASGYDLKQHNNPLASIHGVLKRLAESGDVEPHESNGTTRYRWKDRGVTGSVKIRTDTFAKSADALKPITGFRGTSTMPKRSLKFPSAEKKKD